MNPLKETKLIMGMPITVEVVDAGVTDQILADVFNYFRHVDRVFSTYKPNSEISRINNGLPQSKWSNEMKLVMDLCQQTKRATNSYFDISHNGKLDPSGLVKGWAIHNAAQLLRDHGLKNFYIDAGGDIQVSGHNAHGAPWQVGLRNPFNRYETIKAVSVTTQGVATSGSYIRGQHVYNPLGTSQPTDIVSLTVIGPNIYEADRFATAAFAMGAPGIQFIESLPGFEGYMVNSAGLATLTSGFGRYVVEPK